MRAYVYFYTCLPVFFKNRIISSILFSLENRGITSAVLWLRYYYNYHSLYCEYNAACAALSINSTELPFFF